MYCANCGTPHTEEDSFCANCGTSLKPNFLLGPLNHPLFLTLCILITCGCGLTFIGGEISVINILLTIFFWLTYANAKKDVVSQSHLRSISGTLFASYVVNFVILGLIALVGVLLAISLWLVGTGSWAASFLEIEGDLQDALAGGAAGMTFISVVAILFLIVFLGIAIVGSIINILGCRKIHKFAQSLYLNVSVESPILYKPATVSGWMIVLGIFVGLSALMQDDFMLLLGNAAYSAAFFVGNVWIRKHFSQNT